MLSAAWVFLLIAGVLEPFWVVALKKSEMFKKVPWIIAAIVFLAGSMYLLSLAMVNLPASTSYAVWTGIGAAGTLIAGSILFKESVTVAKLFFVFLIIAGIIGLKLTGGV